MNYEHEGRGALLYQESWRRGRQILFGLVFGIIFLFLAVLLTVAMLGGTGRFGEMSRWLLYFNLTLPVLCVVLALMLLILMLGLHWAMLQSVAWVSMIVTYSKQDTLQVALTKTFDGDFCIFGRRY